MRKMLVGAGLAIAFAAACSPAFAITATVEGTPPVSVTVPSGFAASDTKHGVEIKTPDDEVIVWCETFLPADEKKLQAEHMAYWKDQGVELGSPVENASNEGIKVVADTFTKATWNGKPTLVQYLFIDANLPSKEMILMTVWASPEGYVSHQDDIKSMTGSITVK